MSGLEKEVHCFSCSVVFLAKPPYTKKYCSVCFTERRRRRHEEYKKTPLGSTAHARSKYNLSLDEVETLNSVSNCAICDRYFDTDVVRAIDHDHSTGRVRGVLCKQCNTALGGFKDSTELINKAILYLRNAVRNDYEDKNKKM